MSTLYYARVERRDFGDVLSAEGLSRLDTHPTSDYDALPSPDGNAVLAVWSQDPKGNEQLPHLLICQDGTESDWAAWVTTFAAKIRPFSAHMRLFTDAGLRKVVKEIRTPVLGPLVWPVAGLVLGELLAASRLPDKALDTLPATAYASTLSFVLFRAAATYDDFGQWPRLIEAWESVRRVTKQRVRPVDGASVARVCAIIMDAGGVRAADKFIKRSDTRVSLACHHFMSSPGRVPADLSDFPQFPEAEAMMHGSRENRVIAFEKLVNHLDGFSGQDPELTSFVLGYLASRIAPGTIRHSSVLGPITHRYPTVALWYGFCAGFGEAEVNLPSVAGRRGVDLPVSARRIVRDLLRTESALGPPMCDVGFLELVALSRTGGDPLEGLITTAQGTAIIELVPCVWTTVNVSSKPLTEPPVRAARERTIITALGRQIERLRETYEDLLSDEATGEEGQQRSLFPERRRKK